MIDIDLKSALENGSHSALYKQTIDYYFILLTNLPSKPIQVYLRSQFLYQFLLDPCQSWLQHYFPLLDPLSILLSFFWRHRTDFNYNFLCFPAVINCNSQVNIRIKIINIKVIILPQGASF